MTIGTPCITCLLLFGITGQKKIQEIWVPMWFLVLAFDRYEDGYKERAACICFKCFQFQLIK